MRSSILSTTAPEKRKEVLLLILLTRIFYRKTGHYAHWIGPGHAIRTNKGGGGGGGGGGWMVTVRSNGRCYNVVAATEWSYPPDS